MKFYNRFPDRALAGMAELTLEQIGAYNLIIDLLYSRDGVVPDDDALVARMLHLDLRLWRRVKMELMTAGKVRITAAGMLSANGVDEGRLLAQVRSMSSRHAANVRWENYRKARQIKDPSMPAKNATKIKIYNTETLTNSEAPATIVDEGENFGAIEQPSTKSFGSGELEAIVRAKRWAD